MTDLLDGAEDAPMTTPQIKAAMLSRFAAPEWALLFEVGNATGSGHRTWADAVAMSLWPSRGLEVWGFEFKASRSDWKRELASPKAEPVAKYCDRWFVVAADKVIADANEVPAGWGYIKAAGGKLRTVREAPLRESAEISRGFLAACLRRASEADHDLLTQACNRSHAEGRKAGELTERAKKAGGGDPDAKLREAVAKFERVSGIRIDDYSGERMGEAVQMLRMLNGDAYPSIDSAVTVAERFIAGIREIQARLKVT